MVHMIYRMDPLQSAARGVITPLDDLDAARLGARDHRVQPSGMFGMPLGRMMIKTVGADINACFHDARS